MTDAPVLDDDRLAKANVLRLAIAQALAGANSVVIMTTGAIVGSILAPSLLPAAFIKLLHKACVLLPPIQQAQPFGPKLCHG